MDREQEASHAGMCSHYKEQHDPLLFSSKQLVAPPETKQYIGARAAIKVCPCYIITWAQLVSRLRLNSKDQFCKEIQAEFDLTDFETLAIEL
jgi:hypothetical protein